MEHVAHLGVAKLYMHLYAAQRPAVGETFSEIKI